MCLGQYLCFRVDEEHVFGGGAFVEFERTDWVESDALESCCKDNHHEKHQESFTLDHLTKCIIIYFHYLDLSTRDERDPVNKMADKDKQKVQSE